MSANVDMEWQYSNALPYLLIPSFLQCFQSQSREVTVVKFDGQPINETHTCTGKPGVLWEELIYYVNSLYFT
jgi:hypothetical protein